MLQLATFMAVLPLYSGCTRIPRRPCQEYGAIWPVAHSSRLRNVDNAPPLREPAPQKRALFHRRPVGLFIGELMRRAIVRRDKSF